MIRKSELSFLNFINFNEDSGMEDECKCMLAGEGQIIECMKCRWRRDGDQGIIMRKEFEESSRGCFRVMKNQSYSIDNECLSFKTELSDSKIELLYEDQNYLNNTPFESMNSIIDINKHCQSIKLCDNLAEFCIIYDSNKQSLFLNENLNGYQSKIKMHRFHYNNSIGFNGLTERYDVMNKNFIRFIKREIRRIFKEYLQAEGLKNTNKSHKNNCQLFALHLLEGTSVEWGDIKNFDIHTFRIYLMSLTQYCKFKNLARTAEEINIKEKVYNLMYSFSHTRFYSFIQSPEIRFLILIIKERYKMSEFINQICHSHYSSYRVHISTLLKLIRNQK